MKVRWEIFMPGRYLLPHARVIACVEDGLYYFLIVTHSRFNLEVNIDGAQRNP